MVHKFLILIRSLFEFQVILKKLLNLLMDLTHQVLFDLEFICLVNKIAKIWSYVKKETSQDF